MEFSIGSNKPLCHSLTLAHPRRTLAMLKFIASIALATLLCACTSLLPIAHRQHLI
jgi:hypothetical protein